MNYCFHCGAALPSGAQDVCLACGTLQPEKGAAHLSTDAAVSKPAPHKKKPDKTVRVLLAIVIVLALLLVVASVSTYVLYDNYNADKAYSALGQALLTNNITTLRSLVEGDGITVTDEGLTALCRAFATKESVAGLLTQLKAQAGGNSQAEVLYPAILPSSEQVFLGYASYGIRVKPVTLRIPVIAQNILLTVDGVSRTGETTADGIVYKDFFPGVYACTVTGQTALGELVTGTATDVLMFTPDTPVTFDGALPIANITVSGCVSDAAVITVNDKEVAQKPINGTVTLPQVSVGSTIAMRYTTDYGAVTTGSVQFTDKANTALAMANLATEGGVPAEADLTALLGAFYASYLDAVNAQDAARMNTCTELLRQAMGDTLAAQDKKLVYVFTSATPRMESAAQGTYEQLPAVTLNAKFVYQANKKEDKTVTEKTALYTCELVWQDAAWKLNRMKVCTQADFDANKLTPFA